MKTKSKLFTAFLFVAVSMIILIWDISTKEALVTILMTLGFYSIIEILIDKLK